MRQGATLNGRNHEGELMRNLLYMFLGGILAGCQTSEPAAPDIWFFVLVKSSNYAQDQNGELSLLNYHFFSEIFPKRDGLVLEASMIRHDAPDRPMHYEDRGDNYYIEGGHFETVEAADAGYPNGVFKFSISGEGIDIREQELTMSGPAGRTDIPEPISISLYQGNVQVAPGDIDPAQALEIRWSEYSNGGPGPNGIVDDMIFVVIQDCQGERIVHTGLPFKEPGYLTYRATELSVDGGILQPGQPYAMFVEFPHVVDSVIADGVPGFASFATATYLDLQTRGVDAAGTCMDDMPPMDTGQTDRD